MTKRAFLVLTLALFSIVSGGCNLISVATLATSTAPKKTMHTFRSEGEFRKYLNDFAARQKKRNVDLSQNGGYTMAIPQKAEAGPTGLFTAYDGDSITNVQHAGVDEGGIVKLHGRHLVILRRGRLFTIEVGDTDLKPVSFIDAFAPDIDPTGTWYDELLISDNTIIVIGYSYERGGTEVGLFNIDDQGKLSYRSTYHLRANDYFSSRNYASRLVRGQVIFYSSLYLWPSDDPVRALPALRKWHKGASESEFRSITTGSRIYRPEYTFNGYDLALHTITICDPSGIEMQCNATSVVGPSGHSFYVSPESVYVWTTDFTYDGKQQRAQSLLYRMPLDGSAPSALKVSGGPIDQFSFLESSDKYLNVLVREGGSGDSMWSSEDASGQASLLRVSLTSFSDGGDAVAPANYRKLPTPKGYSFQNRFAGDYLLYGPGVGWGAPQEKTEHAIYAVRWSGGDAVKLSLTHYVDRIEVMGNAAIVVGTAEGDLHFSSISLGALPKVETDYVRRNASQGELRSQGFFYKPDGADSGVLGLPISTPGRAGYEHLFTRSAAILYLRNNALQLKEFGSLEANATSVTEDQCRASCVDWYGQSRPLFLQGRVFALLGYELVEGAVNDGGMKEVRRLNYAPKADNSAGN